MPCLDGSSLEIPVYRRLPVTLARGEGCRVWDELGNEYLDLYGGHAVASLGYGHPRLTEAIKRQAEQLLFQTNAVELEVRQRAIQSLIETSPDGLDRAFLVNSGAEANENALRIAFLATRRTKIVCLRGGFHGRTAAAGAITAGSEKWYGFPQTPFEVETIDVNDATALDAALDESTAALVYEPVQGVAGAVAILPEFAQTAERLTRDRGICTIVDEVQTGVGRTGTMYAVEQLSVRPDIVTVAKGLGGGLPVAAILCTSNLTDGLAIGTLGTTFGGGPMACAAVEVVLDTVGKPEFLESVRARSLQLIQISLEAGATKVSGRGLLLGLHLDRPATGVRARLLELGFLTGDSADPNVLRLLPPLVLSEDEAASFGSALREALS